MCIPLSILFVVKSEKSVNNTFISEPVAQNTADSQHSLYQENILEETMEVATMLKCKKKN